LSDTRRRLNGHSETRIVLRTISLSGLTTENKSCSIIERGRKKIKIAKIAKVAKLENNS